MMPYSVSIPQTIGTATGGRLTGDRRMHGTAAERYDNVTTKGTRTTMYWPRLRSAGMAWS
jgi:hypothetical protein